MGLGGQWRGCEGLGGGGWGRGKGRKGMKAQLGWIGRCLSNTVCVIGLQCHSLYQLTINSLLNSADLLCLFLIPFLWGQRRDDEFLWKQQRNPSHYLRYIK